MANVLVHSLLVGVGGFAGSVGRYLVSLAFRQSSLVLPAGTLTVNVAGCFLIGLIAQASDTGGTVSPEARLALAVGFCGGFTTMSSMVYESAQFLRDSEYMHATAYLLATFLGSLVAFFLGVAIVRVAFRSAV